MEETFNSKKIHKLKVHAQKIKTVINSIEILLKEDGIKKKSPDDIPFITQRLNAILSEVQQNIGELVTEDF